MGIPVSSTGPMPSYFTQRLSRRLLSLVQVADQPGGRGQVGAAPGLGTGPLGAGVLGAFASLAGQVWYQSLAEDEEGEGEPSPLAERCSGEPTGTSPGVLGQVPELRGAPRPHSAVPRGSWKSKLSVSEPWWRMTGTCSTRRGLARGQSGHGEGTEVGQLPEPPRACSSPQPHSPAWPCAGGAPTMVGGRGRRPLHPEPGWRRGAGAGPPWPWGAGMVPRGCPCPAGESGGAHRGSQPALPAAPLRLLHLTGPCRRAGGSGDPPSQPCPQRQGPSRYSEVPGKPRQGDAVGVGGGCRGWGTPPPARGPSWGGGKRLFPARNALAPHVLPMRRLSPPQRGWTRLPPGFSGRPPPPPPRCGKEPPWHPGAVRRGRVDAAGALPPGHVAAVAGRAAPGSLPGPSLPAPTNTTRHKYFPTLQRKQGGERGRSEEASGTGRAVTQPDTPLPGTGGAWGGRDPRNGS